MTENLKIEISKSKNAVMASSKNYILIRTCKQLGGSDENRRSVSPSVTGSSEKSLLVGFISFLIQFHTPGRRQH